MKITVITVAYNSARTIGDTLRSVAIQTHPDIEHIIVDGASKDGTLEQVRRFGSRVTQCISEPDGGIYDAMNKGLALATGDVVGCLNADDMLASPHALARIAEALKDADAAYGDLVYVHPEQTDQIQRRWRSGHYSPSRLKFGWMPPHPTFYVRRERLRGIQYATRYRIAADYDFMLRCLTQTDLRVAYIPEVIVNMRSGGASNHSLKAMWRKSSEDLQIIRGNQVGGLLTLAAKNLRKVSQFL